MKDLVPLVLLFLIFYFVSFEDPIVNESVLNGFKMLHEYAREHVLLCLVPAFFIAGTISALIRKEIILKFLSARTKRYISYPVAAAGGAVLAVCSCTILPLFGGIYKGSWNRASNNVSFRRSSDKYRCCFSNSSRARLESRFGKAHCNANNSYSHWSYHGVNFPGTWSGGYC